jgi:hypothetical protein
MKKEPGETLWPARFLDGLAMGYSVTRAAREAGVTRQAPYELKWRDEEFEAAWVNAEAAAVDVIRDEIYRRGVEGVEEPVFHLGKQVASIRKYDSTLLIFEAKRRDPAYRDRLQVGGSVEVAGTIDHHVALLDGRQPVEVEGSARRAAARALLEAGSENGDGSAD